MKTRVVLKAEKDQLEIELKACKLVESFIKRIDTAFINAPNKANSFEKSVRERILAYYETKKEIS